MSKYRLGKATKPNILQDFFYNFLQRSKSPNNLEGNDSEPKIKYNVYAINKNGDGRVIQIGEYEDITELEISIGHFADDVIITIESEEIKDD